MSNLKITDDLLDSHLDDYQVNALESFFNSVEQDLDRCFRGLNISAHLSGQTLIKERCESLFCYSWPSIENISYRLYSNNIQIERFCADSGHCVSGGDAGGAIYKVLVNYHTDVERMLRKNKGLILRYDKLKAGVFSELREMFSTLPIRSLSSSRERICKCIWASET